MISHIKIHREGRRIVFHILIALVLLNLGLRLMTPELETLHMVLLVISVTFMLAATAFFRNPARDLVEDDGAIIAPADGKIVVVEEVEEPEYFKDRRLQVSIFMSVKNVHVNRHPVSGQVKYFRYHPGNYFLAWHPKSSTKNERTTIVIEQENDIEVLVRQIAGKLARRIVSYLDEGDEVNQGSELGFIKFGSRVDLFLPLGTEVMVNVGEKVKGGKTTLARIPGE
jgi:phosphatidylserine decarboxylase